ncbi:hypothetical protein BDK51DRAFT_32548, partial [Blyttiomyces helicus]
MLLRCTGGWAEASPRWRYLPALPSVELCNGMGARGGKLESGAQEAGRIVDGEGRVFYVPPHQSVTQKDVLKGKITEEKKADMLARITITSHMADFKNVDFAIEMILYNISLSGPAQLFRNLDNVGAKHALLATNTSSIPSPRSPRLPSGQGRLGAMGVQKVIGMHLMNPVSVMKQLCPPLETSPNITVSQLGTFLLSHFGAYSAITANMTMTATLADGKQWYIGVSPIIPDNYNRWLIVVAFPRSDFFAQIDKSITQSSLLIGILTAIGAVTSALFAWLLARPLESLTVSIELLTQMKFSDLQDGKLEHRSTITEIGSLENSFATM